jgi:catechol 2,3-dioxygenase-like lactoylglutathione lyase family enzyme
MIVGLQDVYYNVQDMARSVAFYRDALGMRVLDANDWWTGLDFYGARVGLHWTGGPPVPTVPQDEHGPQCGATLTLRTTDIDTDVMFIVRRGARLVGRSNNDWGRLAVLLDPDGNMFKLMQPPERVK